MYSFSSKYITLLMQIGTTLILARILTPEHIGLFTIASIITGFAQMFRDFGISEYVIKEKQIDSNNLSSAFTASILIAWPIALCLGLSSPFIADYYSDPSVAPLITILSLNVALSPFGSITMSTLRRQMNFKPISYANIASTAVNSGVSLVLAYYDFGPLSLAIASVLGTVTTVLVMQAFRDKRYKITLRLKGIKSVFLFGSGVGSSNIISYFGENFMDMLIAKAYTVSDLGIVSRAKSTISLFSTAVTEATIPLITPYYANAHHNSNALGQAYLKSTQAILYLAFPFCALMLVAPDTVIMVLYGEQWLPAAEFISILAINFAFHSCSIFYDRCLISLDMPKEYFIFGLFFTLVNICLVLLLIDFGIIYILCGIAVSSAVKLVWSLFSLKALIKLNVSDYFNMATHPIIATIFLLAGLLPYLIYKSGDTLLDFLLLIPGGIAWLIYILLFDPNIKNILAGVRKK